MKNGLVLLGVAMLIGGLGAVFLGMLAMDAEPCFVGASCGSRTGDIVFFPVGLASVIVGSAVWMYGAGAASTAPGGTRNPLARLSFFSIFGLAFLGIGLVMLVVDRQPGIDHTTNVLTILGVMFSIAGLGSIGFGVALQRAGAADAHLLATGIRGRATVLAVRDTNVTVNNSPMIALDVRVEIPGQAAFRKTVRTVISRLDVGTYRPGMVLAVAADPAKPQDIAVDWDSSPIADGNASLDPVTGQPIASTVPGPPRSGIAAAMAPTGVTASPAEIAALLRAAADQIAAGQAVAHPAVADALANEQRWNSTGAQLTPDQVAAILRTAAAGPSGGDHIASADLATMLRAASDAAARAADAAEAAAHTGAGSSSTPGATS